MYIIFRQEESIIVLNDDNGKQRILTKQEEAKLFRENALLKSLKDNRTRQVMLDDIFGIKKLP